jgi:hypothetical protein
MAGHLTIRGVPSAVAMDAWWLDDGRTASSPSRQAEAASGWTRRAGALLALIVTGDMLFYGHPFGLNLALFAILLVLLSGWSRGTGLEARAALALLLAVAPVLEEVQGLSLLFLGLGLAVTVFRQQSGVFPGPDMLARFFRAYLHALPSGVVRAVACMRNGMVRVRVKPRAMLHDWALPLGGALILISLLAEANPVLSDWAEQLSFEGLNLEKLLRRGLFWGGLALLVRPVFTALVTGTAERRNVRAVLLPGVNAGSVTKALVLFNLLMAAQTVSDLAILWGGGALPEGMPYAQYAHRGGYPLLLTACLAGAFAIAASPFLSERKGLKALMFLWLGQNVLLTLSAGYRLWLYVGVYGLTYLRIHAAIWMLCVALGLVLVAVQIRWDRPAGWFLKRGGAAGLAVLYLCCFINFAGVIARHNLTHVERLDHEYLCRLGPGAAAALRDSQQVTSCAATPPQVQGWRDWGFRSWRINRYLERSNTEGAQHENPRGG